MVIGILLSGIMAGLIATIGALTLGFPIWAAILLYPLVGTFGAMGFVGLAMTRPRLRKTPAKAELATSLS